MNGFARLAALPLLLCLAAAARAELPVFDAHVHYSHDAWSVVPAEDVVALMRRAGLKHALVSSSDDEGTQKLLAAAPDLVIPSLRPYRRRGEIGTWVRDEGIVGYLEQRLARHRYAAIGEFHLYGADADLPVPRRMIALAMQHGLILHAHSDADAIDRIFRQAPQARVIWAHSGFDRPAAVRELLARHPRLVADLAFRSDMGSDGRVDPDWEALFREYPDRFMVGTDTFTPERLHYIPAHAEYTRSWLRALPPALAERIAWRNAEAFIVPVWQASRARAVAPADGGDAASRTISAALPAPADATTAARDPQARCVAAMALPGAIRQAGRQATLVHRAEPSTIRVGQTFSLRAEVCPHAAAASVDAFAVDATMPAHRHGMNYAPRISRRDGGFDADGLMFHMPGRWQLVFDLRVAGVAERLTHDLVVR